jgi:hypothetical protein
MRIQDKQIRAFNEQLKTEAQPRITDANVLQILAGVADANNITSTKALDKLTAPGITRQEQFDLAKAGLSKKERSDIIELLDKSGYDMDPGARNFLEALLDRAPLENATGDPLSITADVLSGIKGKVDAGSTIEAINLSTAPSGRLHLEDTVEIGKADASGKFAGNLPDIKEGDIIRLRERKVDGSVGDWVTIRAAGVDKRNAEINLERFDVLADASGNVEFKHNTGRPLSEPGAQMRLVNKRTGEAKDFTFDDKGSLATFKIPGKPGDEFSVAVSDGKNNTAFTELAGVLKVPGSSSGGGIDLPDPKPLNSDDGRYALERYTGPLFIDGPDPGDVRQGAIGNCYFPAAMAAIAHTDADAIKNMIKENGDGTYTVTFFDNLYRNPPTKKEVTIDGDLYSRSWGGPIYGSSLGGSTTKDKMELWYPLIEKAYAQWKGSYESIGNGGISGDVMAAVLGKDDRYTSLGWASPDDVFKKIKEAETNKWPATAGTHGKDRADIYTNTGVYANHAYSVLGAVEENGVKYVKLRNPWGQSEPGYDGKNDGFFKLELDKFMKLYSSIAIVPA